MVAFRHDDRCPVVVAGCRTPFLRSGTDFHNLMAYDLARMAIKGLVDLAGISAREIQHVIFGCVLNPPQATNVAREALIGAGLPRSIPAHTVIMACISGNQAVTQAAELIARGQADVVVAGGAECLSDIPILLRRPLRKKLLALKKLRTPRDYLAWLRGWQPAHLLPEIPKIAEFSTGHTMGESADRLAARWGVSREDQDRYALRSHQLAAAATLKGLLAEEVLALPVPPRFQVVERDNGIRGDTSMEKLERLPPAFFPDYGTVTAGNSSFLTDGAAAVLLMSRVRARDLGCTPLARLVGYQYVGCDPLEELLLGPAYAVPKVLRELGLALNTVDVFEFHEAFAGQVLANLRALDSENFGRENLGLAGKVGAIPMEHLNAQGGSLSLGHPFGATGIRLVNTCCRRLQREDGQYGLISSCAAGGLGNALVLERLP